MEQSWHGMGSLPLRAAGLDDHTLNSSAPSEEGRLQRHNWKNTQLHPHSKHAPLHYWNPALARLPCRVLVANGTCQMFARLVHVKYAVSASGCTSLRFNPVQRLWRAAPPARSTRTMATSSKIHLSPSQQPVFYLPGISSETADLTSELLQENHEKHHVFFNYAGFHVCPSLA